MKEFSSPFLVKEMEELMGRSACIVANSD